jgi:hypothetical protein
MTTASKRWRSNGSAMASASTKTAPPPDVEKMSAPHYAFKVGYPTPQAAQRAQDEQDLQRALQSYRFFHPTVSVAGVFQGTRAAGGPDNKGALILSGAPRHVLFTGNSDTPYMGATFNLKEIGPLVIELPAGPYLGIVNDHNFGWVHDIGLPGPDAGKGGKHLILPPNYKDDVPPGYFTVRSKTNYILVGARALPPGGDMAAGLEAQRRVKMYPLARAANPPAFEFIDRTNDKIDITLLGWEDNIKFWEKLRKVLQEEPAIEEFRPMTGMLANLGIEQGKPISPDASMRAILERAAKIGRDQMLVAGFGSNRLTALSGRIANGSTQRCALRMATSNCRPALTLRRATAGSRGPSACPQRWCCGRRVPARFIGSACGTRTATTSTAAKLTSSACRNLCRRNRSGRSPPTMPGPGRKFGPIKPKPHCARWWN